MRSSSLLFFTAATGPYLPFFPLYTYFAHSSNPGACFEFIVDDPVSAEIAYGPTLAFLRESCGIEIVLRSAEPYAKKLLMDNSLRFVLTPTLKTDLVYIGDIDILIIEDVRAAHSRIFEAGLPYSNIIRPGTKRLTGLHFTRYDAYYPIPDIEDIIFTRINDEELLYQIVKRSGHLERQSEIDATKMGRPTHGIHMSLNRIPFTDTSERPDWSISWNRALQTNKVVARNDFWDFVRSLPRESRRYLANVYFLQKGIVEGGRQDFDLFTERDAPSANTANPVEKVFTRVYETNAWKGTESLSGPSSGLARTENLRNVLPGIVEKYGIKTFLDAPCGDFFWMKEVAPTLPTRYIGGDIVESLVTANRTQHEYPNVEFIKLNLITDRLPTADILFCRDCLFHLSYQDIAKALQNFLESDCRFLMTTSHINRTGFKNADISTGGWRWFDLLAEPFNFPDNFVEAVLDGGGDRYMYLWRKEDIAPAIRSFARQRLQAA